MELLIGVVALWCYLVSGFVVLALMAGAIEPFDTGDIGDAGIGTILFWPVVIVRTIILRLWRFRQVDRALKQTHGKNQL